MESLKLDQAVGEFARLTYELTDQDLERPWIWQDYEEGVRFSFFRIYEELRDLAAKLGAERGAKGPPQTVAQRVMAQYHAGFRDLQTILLPVTNAVAERAPAEGEWPLKVVLIHIIQSELGFFKMIRYSLDRYRSKDDLPLGMTEGDWKSYFTGHPFLAIREEGSFSDLLAYYAELHSRVLETLGRIQDDELDAPCIYWERIPMPAEFRLHRIDSHLRQHSIQVENAMEMLGLGPNEARRLLRLIYAALAEVEGVLIGAEEIGAESCQALAEQIAARTQEISAVLRENGAR